MRFFLLTVLAVINQCYIYNTHTSLLESVHAGIIYNLEKNKLMTMPQRLVMFT